MCISYEAAKELFYKYYESKWDYSHNILERGYILTLFISNVKTNYTYLFKRPFPRHLSDLSDLPQGFLEDYKKYMWNYMKVNLGYSEYTLRKAVENFLESYEDGKYTLA